MKPTMTIFVCMLAAGLATAQSPSIIDQTRATMNGVRDSSAAASNAALKSQDQVPLAAAATHSGSAKLTPASASGNGKAANGNAKVASHAGVAKVSAAHPTHMAAHKDGHAHARAGVILPNAGMVARAPAGVSAGSAPGSGSASGNEAVSVPVNAGTDTENDQPGTDKWSTSGKRDPFISPVVRSAGGPACSTGKKCLEIGTINLHGIVHSENGFIAVVSNSLNKAYFLRENDPVFNGYVVKITGDSITFQETLQDRLGKTFTREVVKKITTPAV